MVLLGYLLWFSKINVVPHLISVAISSQGEEFPDIDRSELSPTQDSIVMIVEAEFKAQPDYRKYSEGTDEPWCADFVSWVYKSAGVPFSNPNSGSWRIPGTYTLRDYLNDSGRLNDGEAYRPKTGDLVLYDNPNSFGQHVNIVLSVNEEGSITTVGGNEPGGIRVKTHEADEEPGFVGYGVL